MTVATVIPIGGRREPSEWLNEVTATTMLAPLPEVAWLSEGIRIAPGAPTLVAGYGYSGKSVALQSMAVSVASGLPIWRKFSSRRGKVRHLDYEQGFRITAERYQRLSWELGCAGEILDHLVADILPKQGLDSCDDLSFLGDGCALCILDSWRAAHPGVDENSSEVRRTFDRMTVASEKTGCVFLVLHHTRKPQKDSAGGSKMAIRGSSGFFDGSQTVYTFDGTTVGLPLVKLEKDRLGGQELPGFALRVEDTDGGRGLRVTYESVSEAMDPTPVERLEDLSGRILTMLGGMVNGCSATLAAELLEKRKSSVLAALQSLEAEGKVERVGHGPAANYRRSVPELNGSGNRSAKNDV